MSLLDPYNQRRDYGPVRFLHRLNPLAKLFGPLPAMVMLIFVRDWATPLSFIALGLLLILVGAHLSRGGAILLAIIPVALLIMSVSFGVWTDPSKVEAGQVLFTIGDWQFTSGAWAVGAATALRLGALIVLALIGGLTTTGPDLVRSSIQHLRLPYRVGYAALAAYRFVPRFAHELEVIRAAHRVRGMAGGRGPIAAVRRGSGYVVPLLAGGIRHAERVALAMDARGFGAHPTRTERYLVPLRARDVVFVLLFWAATVLFFVFAPQVVPFR